MWNKILDKEVVSPPSEEKGNGAMSDNMERTRVLIDRYHHRSACEWVSNFTVTGKFSNNLGRYGLDDSYHTNGYFNLQPILGKEFELVEYYSPLTAESLVPFDMVVIINPDYQQYSPPQPGPAFDPREIGAIHDFVARGGTLIMMINSYLPAEDDYMWKENYNIEDVNKILEPFGVVGGNHISGHSEVCEIQPDDPLFGGIDRVEYGHGGQLFLQKPALDDVKHHIHFGNDNRIYCVSARTKSARVFVMADAGFMSNGLVTVPWAKNREATERIFLKLRPDWLIKDDPYRYESSCLRVAAYPHESRLTKEHFMALNPSAELSELYNYHYVTDTKKEMLDEDSCDLPADPMSVINDRVASVEVELLCAQLAGSVDKITINVWKQHQSIDGDLARVCLMGMAGLPQQSLAAACRNKLPAFEMEEVQGGVQTLRWEFAFNLKKGVLKWSCLKLFSEPAWIDDNGAERSVNFSLTRTLSPASAN